MLKIAVIGPESTGKTELCRKLAVHFHAEWVPEMAREYVEKLEDQYTFEDVCSIARLQIEQEQKYGRKTKPDYIFFDTDLIVTKVWLAYKYDFVPDFVNERLASRFFDFYLICLPDIPWEYDPVRENGDKREFFYAWYENEINVLGTPYSRIGGSGEERLQNALQAIKIFETNRKSNTF